MTPVTVSKTKLLETLRSNRENHRKIFLEAQEGYRGAAIAELDRMIQEARGGKKIRRSLTLIEPVDQTGDYDRAIRMLEMSIDDSVKLAEDDFQCYVMDEWRWKQQFTASNFNYSKTLQDSIPET